MLPSPFVRAPLVFVVLALFAGCRYAQPGAGTGLTSAAVPGIDELGRGPKSGRIVKFSLENGLQVVLEENHSAPVAAVQAWVRVGAADEPDRLAGVSHFLEHMLFKGTKRRGVGQIAREIEQAGGEINAWTSFDETVYHVVVASEFLEVGLDVLADALTQSSFVASELERERGVILEEVKQGLDDPDRGVTQRLFSGAFPHHPYGRPVIGSLETVSAMTRADVRGFYQERYVAPNVTLVVVGDFDAAKTRQTIERLYAGMRPAPKRAPQGRPPLEGLPPAWVDVLARDVKESQVMAAFRIPSIRHEDIPALDLLAVVLGQGESSRLNLEVVRNRQLAKSAFAYAFGARDGGVLVAGAVTGGGRVDQATSALLDEVLRLSRVPVSGAELEKARTILESDRVYDRETVQGYARKVGFYATIVGDLHYEPWYLAQLRAVSPTSLQAVANKYLRTEHLSLVAQVPEGVSRSVDVGAAKERLQKVIAGAEVRADKRFRLKPPSAAVRDEVVVQTLPGGAKLIVMRDPSVPIMSVRAMWLGGLRYEDARTNGVSNMIGALLSRGTRTRSAERIMHEVEGLAGSLTGYAGRNSVGLQAEFLSRNWEQGLDLVGDCLLHASFPDPELDKERRIVLDDIRAQDDNLGQAAFRLFQSLMWKRHPYRMDLIGTADSVSGLTRRRLVIHFRKHYPPGGLTLSVVGDVEPARVVEKLTSLFRDADVQAAEVPAVVTEPTLSAPAQAIQYREREQAHVVLGFPGTTLASPDRFGLEVLSHVLAGQGGRLFEELREKRGLVYRVSAFSLEGIDPGYFAVYLASSPEKLEQALEAVRRDLRRLADEGITAEELGRAQRYLIGTHAIGLQRKGSLAAALAFHEAYGEGWEAYKKFPQRIRKITRAEVQRLAQKYLDPKREVLAVIRPPEGTPAVSSAGPEPRAAKR